jgi:hypothetical protein
VRAEAWFVLVCSTFACGGAEEAPVRSAEPVPTGPVAPPATAPPVVAETPVPDAGDTAAVEDAGAAAPVEAGPPVPRPVNVKLPGKCVDTQLHAAKEMVKLEPTNPDVEAWKEFVGENPVDLDDDGIDDAIRFGGAANMTTRSFVYVKRGSCGHYVGMIESTARLAPLATRHRGLVDLGGEAGCQVDCCPNVAYEEWRFDGVRYKRAVKKTVKRECSARF